jgi:hypothetical protein
VLVWANVQEDVEPRHLGGGRIDEIDAAAWRPGY